jgi:hypothetical protein
MRVHAHLLGMGGRNPARSSQSCQQSQQPWDCVRDSIPAGKCGGGPGSRGTPAFDPGRLPPGRLPDRCGRGVETAARKPLPPYLCRRRPVFGPSDRSGRPVLPCILAATPKRKDRPRLFLSSCRKVAGCMFPWWHLRHASPTKGPCCRDPSRTFPFGWGFRFAALESGCWFDRSPASAPHRGWPILAAMINF